MNMKLIRIAVLMVVSLAMNAQAQEPLRLKFKAGEQNRLNIVEELKLTLYQPQVDDEFIEPSIRVFDYSFTENIEKVNADGSASIAITLDSFKTVTFIGEGRGREEYFNFNSSYDTDLRQKFRDIKAYPRAQFLGHTLRFTVGSDGMIRNFDNLVDFQTAANGKGFEYDMVRAILALSDTLRMGQLLEQGFGGLPALGQSNYTANSTVTEIPVIRAITSTRKGDSIFVTAKYSNPPERIEYLEGVAIPIVLTNFGGDGKGKFVVKKGKVVWGQFSDSAMVDLNIDPEVIPYKAIRNVTVRRTPIELMRGANIQIKETEQHRGIPKAPELVVPEDAIEVEIPGSTIESD
jgi:hypothetical protein